MVLLGIYDFAHQLYSGVALAVITLPLGLDSDFIHVFLDIDKVLLLLPPHRSGKEQKKHK